MKTGLFFTLAFLVFAGTASAQKIQSTKRLVQEEVPIMIIQAFQKDFSAVTEKGYWKLIYTEDTSTSKLTPEMYTFSFKRNGEKAEIAYKPDATIDHTKGVEATNGSTQK